MRFYSVAVTSLTIGAPLKWTDNLLSQHEVLDVAHFDRGVARGISWSALVRIGLIRTLNHDLGCGVRDAVSLAQTILEKSEAVAVADFLTLRFDRAAFEATLRDRLREVIETAPRPRRGRPPRRVARQG